MNKDIQILQELAKQYAEISVKPEQEQKRKLWSDHFSLKKTRPPVLIGFGMGNHWCKEIFSDKVMKCEDSFYRSYERKFRIALFHNTIEDDYVFEPWIGLRASVK